MELERPLRSAWANRGGWSANATASNTASDNSAPSTSTGGASTGGVGTDVLQGVGTVDADADIDIGEEREEMISGALCSGDVSQTGRGGMPNTAYLPCHYQFSLPTKSEFFFTAYQYL